MNAQALKNRSVAHRRVRAADLPPHPCTHWPARHAALNAILAEVGLARSVLAYVADADKHVGADAPLMFENADLIHRYTRADAIRDGVLIDVSRPLRR
jgi:hypothetical protein